MPIPMFNSIGGDRDGGLSDDSGVFFFFLFFGVFFLFGTHSPSSMCLPALHLLSVGTWQSSPTVPVRQTHCPPDSVFGNWQVVWPQVPSWYDRALQHMPLIRKFGDVQVVVVGVGQLPSLLRFAPSGQPDGGVRPQVPAWYDRASQHMSFTRKFGNVQVVVVGVGQFPSLLRGAPSGQPGDGGGGGGAPPFCPAGHAFPIVSPATQEISGPGGPIC